MSAPSAEATIGARLVGACISLVLESAVLSESFRYWHSYSGRTGDSRWTQSLVAIISAISIVHTIALIQSTYEVHVMHFDDPMYLTQLPIGVAITGYTSGITASLVQAYFARKAWMLLSKPMSLAILFGLLISYVFVSTFTFPSLNIAAGASFTQAHIQAIQGTFASWLVTSMAVDLLICGILFFKLSKLRKESAFGETHSMIMQILLFSTTTCLITSLLIVATAALYFGLPETQYFFITYQPLGKVYALSLLVQLHNRPSRKQTSQQTTRVTRMNGISNAISIHKETIRHEEHITESGSEYTLPRSAGSSPRTVRIAPSADTMRTPASSLFDDEKAIDFVADEKEYIQSV